MNEALQQIADLSPLAAIIVIGGVIASALTQIAKQASWSKAKTQRVALGLASVVGVIAYIVSGVAVGIPDQWQQIVGTAVVVIAGVAIMARAAYALIGHALPDGTEEESDHEPTHRADG